MYLVLFCILLLLAKSEGLSEYINMAITEIDRPEGARIGVWVDQDAATGSGIQEEWCPEVFIMGRDGLAYTHVGRVIFGTQRAGIVCVPEDCEAAVVEAALDDPSESVNLEFVKVNDDGFVNAVWSSVFQDWRPHMVRSYSRSDLQPLADGELSKRLHAVPSSDS